MAILKQDEVAKSPAASKNCNETEDTSKIEREREGGGEGEGEGEGEGGIH